MDKIKEIAKAVYNSSKVRLAAKTLGVAILVVIAEMLGLGEGIITIISGF